MSVHGLLNSLYELRNIEDMPKWTYYPFLHNRFNKFNKTGSINVIFWLSHDTKIILKIILKSRFCREKINVLPYICVSL